MEAILNNVYDLIDILIKSDPAIFRVMLFDPDGTEIYQYAKMWNKAKKYTSTGAMISQIFKNSEKFLDFLRGNFVFYWNFENAKLIAANSEFGFIALLCENDVDMGFVKTILLRQGIPLYKKIMAPIQD